MNSEPPLTAEQEQLLQKLALAVEVSQGNFYLIFAHCNYIALQEQLATRLAQLCPIKTVVIQPTDTTLYTAIGQQLAQKKATAVQVLGLEGIASLGQLLAATDPVREEFRNHFHFPLVIWVNNTVQSQWIHSAPNLESWGVTKDFAVSSEFIANFLQKKAEQVFLENLTISRADAVALEREIAAARDDLAQANLAPEVEANLKALLGFTKEIHHQFDEAIVYYQEALSILQLLSSPLIRGVEGERTSFPAEGDIFSDSESFPILERLGKVLQYLTFCSYRKAVTKKKLKAVDWQETRNSLQQTLQVFERVNRPDFVANSLTFLGQILRTLEEWETLEKLAETALVFHQQQGQAIKIAEDTGFLAEVALAQGKNQQAIRLTQEAMKIYPQNVSEPDTAPSRFRLIQGKAQQHLGEFSAAIQSLETAKALSFPAGDEQLYLEILASLQQLYFEQEQDYLKAFQLSQEIVQTKQAFGQFAFVGANPLQSPEFKSELGNFVKTENEVTLSPEIRASGWEKDVRELVQRVIQKDYKVMVLCGESGVGKSSLVKAGLMPSLKGKMVAETTILPVAMWVYSDWMGELGRRLGEGLDIPPNSSYQGGDSDSNFSEQGENSIYEKERTREGNQTTQETILGLLQQCNTQQLRVVLIFDQFEEFFFNHTTTAEQHRFFEFLGHCLKNLSLKVVFSLRKDYLHYLLDVPGMESISHDILSKEVLYPIRNFSPQEAKEIIERLTAHSSFQMEEGLIEQLVTDLTEDGKVRPIELQVVGAQLQEEDIRTLAQYREAGTKAELVQRYLNQVVKGCGEANENIASLVLYLLTDDRGTRPLKTRTELVVELQELRALARQLTIEAGQLDLVLEILVLSGLVVLVPEKPEERYQLLHDYLVRFIREQQEPKIQEVIAQLEQEREKGRQLERSLQQVKGEIETAEQTKQQLAHDNRKARRWVQISSVAASLLLLVAVGAGWWSSGRVSSATKTEKAAKKEVEEAQRQVNQAQAAAQAAENQRLQANTRVSEADKKAKTAQQKRVQADKKATDATKKVAAADKNLQQARMELGEAFIARERVQQESRQKLQALDERVRRAQNKVNEAERQVAAAEATQQQAQAEANEARGAAAVARAKVEAAQDELAQAETLRQQAEALQREAEAGTQFERQGTSALRQFEYQQIEALLTAMKAGRGLQKWVKDGQPLDKYPAASPLLALNNILNQIRERNQLQHKGWVRSAQFSPDGQRIVTASDDGTARVWDSSGKELATLDGHQDRVWSAQFSPDGQRIVTASYDGTARVWDSSGKELATLNGHQSLVRSAQFSPDGERIVTVSVDGTARVWDSSGKLLATLNGHQSLVGSAQFSPDGQRIVTASDDGTARVWDSSGKELATLNGHQDRVWSAQFSPDGQRIVTASDDGTARVWDSSGKELATLNGHQESVWSAQFSPDGERIVTASYDRTARVWDSSGKELATLNGHQSLVRSAQFSPDGQRIVTASEDKTARVWDSSGKELATLNGHQELVGSAQFSPDGQRIVTASEDKTARVWDSSGKELATLNGHQELVWSAQFSPDGERIVTASWDWTARVWDSSGKELVTLNGHQSTVWSAQFSPDGQRIVTASWDWTARVWDSSGKELATLDGHQHWVRSAQFSPDGERIVTASVDKTARVWDSSGKELATLNGHQDRVWSAQFSPDGQRIVTASDDRTARVWDSSGKLLATLDGHQESVSSAQFSPDGERIVTASDDGTARVWDSSGKLLATLNGHQDRVWSAQFSPDGERIVTASYDRTARVWDSSGKELATLDGHQHWVRSAQFSPDGERIVTASVDKTAKVWRVENLEQLLERGCEWLNDYLTHNPDGQKQKEEVCPVVAKSASKRERRGDGVRSL